MTVQDAAPLPQPSAWRKLDNLLYNAVTVPLRPFYRRYPLRSPVSVASANRRGLVDLQMGVFCSRIPKAANSTVVTHLARLRFGQAVPSKKAKKLFLTPAHLSSTEVAKLDSLHKFCIVRDPFSRVLSAYLDKVARPEVGIDPSLSFADFLSYLEGGGLHKNAHWAPQTDLLLLPLDAFDQIGRVESLNADLRKVEEALGIPSELQIEPTLGNATGASDKLRRYYTEASLSERVVQLYRADFEALGYPTELAV